MNDSKALPLPFLTSRRGWLIGLLLAHAALALNAAWRTSPVWDEIVYPAEGFEVLHAGLIPSAYSHPPLGKVLMALPYLPWLATLKTRPRDGSTPEAFGDGFRFIHHNTLPAKTLIFLPRLAIALLSVALACLVYIVAGQWAGPAGGLLALFLYSFSPPVLARASLGLLEIPLALFMTAALYAYSRWRQHRKPADFWVWALCWLCAMLTKTTALILLPVFILSDAVPTVPEKRKWFYWLETPTVLVGVFLICEMIMRLFGQSYWVSMRQVLAHGQVSVYFLGTFRDSAPFYAAFLAMLIKTPLPLLVLAVSGWVLRARRSSTDRLLIVSSCLVLVAVITMVAERSIIATAHYFYLYPVLCWLAAPTMAEKRKCWTWIIGTACASLLAGTLWVHPNYLAYFNLLSGGSSTGYRWLADSDQDWGQGLPELAAWIKKEKLSQILLGYSGAGDPRVYGIQYQDVLSPALITGSYRGELFPRWPDRIVLALGTKVAQSEPRLLGWLLVHRKPIRVVGYTFLIYDLTGDREALDWLSWFYAYTRRPALAVAFKANTTAPSPTSSLR